MENWTYNKFQGPGNFLEIPIGPMIHYPEEDCPMCKNGFSKELPHGFYPRLRVMYGQVWRTNNKGHVEICERGVNYQIKEMHSFRPA